MSARPSARRGHTSQSRRRSRYKTVALKREPSVSIQHCCSETRAVCLQQTLLLWNVSRLSPYNTVALKYKMSARDCELRSISCERVRKQFRRTRQNSCTSTRERKVKKGRTIACSESSLGPTEEVAGWNSRTMEAKSRDERDIEGNVNFHGEARSARRWVEGARRRFARNRRCCEEGE